MFSFLFSSKFKQSIPNKLGDIKINSLKNESLNLNLLQGKVSLFVNVASKWGLTKQSYEDLVTLYSTIDHENFEIIASPCSQFGNQEFAEPSKIEEFVKQFGVTFWMTEKINVNGAETHPLYLYLKANADFISANGSKISNIGWNFGKFLTDQNGKVFKYYGPRTRPALLKDDIMKLIDNKAK